MDVLALFITFISIFIVLVSNQHNFISYVFYGKINSLKFKVDKRLVRNFSIAICIFVILTFVFLRWSFSVNNIIQHNLFNLEPSEFRSANLSIFFMLDLCSILGVLLPILKIIDNKKKRFLIPASYLSVLGGSVTILFLVPDLYSNHSWDLTYFIFGPIKEGSVIGNGNGDEPLMFLMHLWMLLIGLHTIINSKKVSINDFLMMLAFILMYAIYIYLISTNLLIFSHVTATSVGDFQEVDYPNYYSNVLYPNKPHPSYEAFSIIYKAPTWQLSAIYAWITFFVIICLMISIKNIFAYSQGATIWNLNRFNVKNSSKNELIEQLKK